MTQTTNFFGLVSGSPKLEYNTTGGSTFTDATGELVSVDLPDNLRDVGNVHTLDGDMPLLAPGKIAAGQMKVRGIYTGASSGFFQDALVAYQTGTALYFRFYPTGSAAGRYRFSSGYNAVGSAGSTTNGMCYVQGRAVPSIVDAEKADVFTYEIPIMTPGWTGASL
jgi:hypothetical protein